MSVATFLHELKSRDVTVWPEGDQLRCNAPAGVLTPALRDELSARKADIVAFLRSADEATRQQRAIIPLQPRGRAAPIFAIGGHNGDVFCYRRIAEHLGNDQPFFGLQPPGVEGERDPLTSVAALASYFGDQIESFRPMSPPVIAGYCAGGAIAFELARQITGRGGQVAFVALFAGRYPAWFRPLSQARQRVFHYADRVYTHARTLGSLTNAERYRYARGVLDRLTAGPAPVDAPPNDSALTRRAMVQQATMTAVCRYRPGFFAGRVAMFLPSAKARRSREGLTRWRGLAQRFDEYCGPDGCEGDGMLLEPHVSAIAALFRTAASA